MNNPVEIARRSSVTSPTIYQLLSAKAGYSPESSAILALENVPLTYERLQRQIQDGVTQLNELGIGRNDRVALVLPNGPEMAAAFLAVASGATCAPLNPAYRAPEFDFYLSDLNAKALVILAGLDSPAREVARVQGIPVIELAPILDGAAGLFTLAGSQQPLVAPAGLAQPDDIALVLYTSGTTARPKLVPLTQRHLCASAGHIRQALELVEGDRCLNVMPLFHAHGLIIGLLSSLLAGGSVVCPPGFDAVQFWSWLESFRPTWYTAAPTIHQSIVEYAASHPDLTTRHALRFIRSSAASLPPHLLAQLESVFHVPVLEGYGMTECIQITSNPPPPRQHKAGSAGVVAGPEVAVMNEAGILLPPGEIGEIVIRGMQEVMPGYDKDPLANESAFTKGWFRTGDQGYLDEEGYLFITGRLKEIINRGGQKISPREVEEVLLQHPAILQAVTFAVTHPRLGEDVVAAVVLRPQAAASTKEIREFAATQLADFKVPSQVLILPEIPKGPTGKLQRLGLAERLGLSGPEWGHSGPKTEFAPTPTPVEEQLAAIWRQLLKLEQIDLSANFFQLGGDSILATQVIARVQAALQVKLPLRSLFEAPTLAEFVQLVRQAKQQAPKVQRPALRPVIRELPLSKQPDGGSCQDPGPAGDQVVDKDLKFSLFFFSADGSKAEANKYHMFLESVKFADRHGFTAVWMPERHFHAFGGLYPDPSVLGAAIATITEQIQIRAGSVVLPLQDPLRVAEEWSVIDNLSRGRVGIACAPGWHANDFVLSPANYNDRKKIMFERLETIQRLWQGEAVKRLNGVGEEVEIRILPKPLQPKLPVWLASHGDETFIRAGQLGVNVLTALWNTTPEELARQIGLYRQALAQHGHEPERGIVTLMIHTFIGDTPEMVTEKVKSAYREYLSVNLGLQKSRGQGVEAGFNLTEDDKDFIVSNATEQLFHMRGLIGTPAVCLEKSRALRAIGADEIACLIDFGLDFEAVMTTLQHLAKLKASSNSAENVGKLADELISL